MPRADPARYAGTRYEIASFSQGFQEGCVDTAATHEGILARLQAQGYDTSRLRRTMH